MYEEILSEIGLTKSEISVYFALLDLGTSTTGPIIEKAKISSGKAYIILDKLTQKGLVTYVLRSGRKYYQAKDPERLFDYLKEKEDEIKEKETKLREILPNLKARYEGQKSQPLAEIFEGYKGFLTFYELILKEMKRGDTIYVLGVSLGALSKFNAYLLDWNKRRISLGIGMKILYNNDAKPLGKHREKMKLTEVRYMSKEIETPAWIDIFGDYVATINTQGNNVLFLIKDKNSAESYRKYFEALWKLAKR